MTAAQAAAITFAILATRDGLAATIAGVLAIVSLLLDLRDSGGDRHGSTR